MDCKEKVLSENYVDIIEESILFENLQKNLKDFCVQRISDNISNIYVNKNEVRDAFPNTEMYSVLPKCYASMGGDATGIASEKFNLLPLSESGVFDLQNPPLNLTGRGIILAIIDSGIDYTDSLFRNADGTTRIRAIWDQSNQDGFSPPGFFYGSFFTSSDLNAALKAEKPLNYVNHFDKTGHGTMMAAISGGRSFSDSFMYTSPAPDAEYIVVKLKEAKDQIKELYKIPTDVSCYEETDVLAALSFVRSFLETAGVPVVICLGVGSSMGNRAGKSALENYISELANSRNLAIVCGTGNQGNDRRHYEGVFQVGDVERKTVEFSVPPGVNGFFMEFWATEPAVFSLYLRSPSGEMTPLLDSKTQAPVTYSFLYGEGSVTANYVLAENYTGWQAVYFRFDRPQEGIWSLLVTNDDKDVISRFHVWLPMEEFLKENVFFIQSTPFVTMNAPASARGIITVSGYDSDNGGFYLQSSRGYTSEDGKKPDFAAPAVDISTPFGARSGTETAAALTAGCVCQLMEWAVTNGNDRNVDGNKIRNYLLRGAARDPGLQYPNREWGYGTLDMEKTMERLAGI